MCGICGVYSTHLVAGELDLFQKLLFINALRGQDSTGVLRVSAKKKAHVQKSLLPSYAYVADEPEILKPSFKSGEQAMLMMGHARAATKGLVTLKNAHPFRFGSLIGFHNGTLNPPYSHKNDFETDSEALFCNIEEMGLVKALEEIQDYTSAYALQWVDLKANKLCFVTNGKRPLHFTFISGGQTLAWSSDIDHLRTAIKYSSLSATIMQGWKLDEEKDVKYFTLKENCLLTFDLGESLINSRKLEMLKVEKKTYSYSVPAVQYSPPRNTTTGGGTGTTPKTSANSAVILTGARMSVPGAFARKPDGSFHRRAETSTAKETSKSLEQGTPGYYGNFRKRFGDDSLKRLDWLLIYPDEDQQPVRFDDLDDLPWEENKENIRTDGEGTLYVKGFQGREIKENEMRYRLKGGCFCCGSVFSLDDPHDFQDINSLHWCDDQNWACNDCYNDSDGDWVKLTVDHHGDKISVSNFDNMIFGK